MPIPNRCPTSNKRVVPVRVAADVSNISYGTVSFGCKANIPLPSSFKDVSIQSFICRVLVILLALWSFFQCLFNQINNDGRLFVINPSRFYSSPMPATMTQQPNLDTLLHNHPSSRQIHVEQSMRDVHQ